jgi:hypothetical protein
LWKKTQLTLLPNCNKLQLTSPYENFTVSFWGHLYLERSLPMLSGFPPGVAASSSKPVTLIKGKIVAIARGTAGAGIALALSRGGSKTRVSPSLP